MLKIVELSAIAERHWHLTAEGQSFDLQWSSAADWKCVMEPCRISPSYGVAVDSQRLVWRYQGSLADAKLTVDIAPVD